MRRPLVIGGLIVTAQILGSAVAVAGPWEDGMAAYNRGDYVQGNPKAQNALGVMYRKGEGVTRNRARAFMWFSFAAKRGDAKAKAGLREVSQAMTPEEISTARDVAQGCEASNYRSCEY
jgi:TPR repeat protein